MRLGGPGCIVEIDETAIGGKSHDGSLGRYAGNKPMVLGMLEKGGELITRIVPNVKMHNLIPVVHEHVLRGTHIHTDALPSYQHLGKHGYRHSKVRHQWKEYVGSEGQTVNHIEGFWNILKRGINGTYIHVSEKHLSKYLGEFEYRWNMRTVGIVAVERRHVFADFMAHAPRGLVRHANLALDALGGNAVSGGREEEHHEEPIAQAGPRAIERRPGGRVKLVRTPVTLISAASTDAAVLGRAVALGAIKVCPVAHLKQVVQTAILGRKAALKLPEGRCLALRHSSYIAIVLTCFKGINTAILVRRMETRS